MEKIRLFFSLTNEHAEELMLRTRLISKLLTNRNIFHSQNCQYKLKCQYHVEDAKTKLPASHLSR